MTLHLILQITATKQKFDNDWKEIILMLFFTIFVTIIFVRIKARRISFEEKIIQTISKNRILDQKIFDGLSSEDMKMSIRQEIKKMNNKRQFIDLEKMEKLVSELTFNNLQKLYQWFFYKGSC